MGWRELKVEEIYSEEALEERLKEELPHWYYENRWIRKKYKTHGWESIIFMETNSGY